MQEFLDRFAKSIADDVHVAMMLDEAGWHGAGPTQGTRQHHVDPAAGVLPRTQSVERLWLYLKERLLSHRLHDDYDAVIDAACTAWSRLVSEVSRIGH